MSQSLSLTSARRATTTPNWWWAGVLVAVLLHAAIIVAALITWQHKLELADMAPSVVPVDLVTPADKTNIAPTVVRDQPKPVDVTPPVPAPPPPAPPPPQAEAAPEPVPSQPVVPKPAPLPKPMVKPEAATPPKPTPAKPKPKADDVNALLDDLTKTPTKSHNQRVADRTTPGIGQMNAATMDIADALRAQIKRCWTPLVGAPQADDLVVDFDLFLSPDGSVAQTPQLTADSQSRLGNPYTRAAADAARRAIYECQPYKLPPGKYALWREINPFHFDPRKMLGP